MHNEIEDFYAHMSLTHERHLARCFCRYSRNIAQRYFLHNKKKREGGQLLNGAARSFKS